MRQYPPNHKSHTWQSCPRRTTQVCAPFAAPHLLKYVAWVDRESNRSAHDQKAREPLKAASSGEECFMRSAVRPRSRRRFSILLIKPSHYDHDGYVIRWLRST